MAQIQVTLADTVHGRHLKLRLPDDVLLEQLVPALARKLGLPQGEYALTVGETDAPLATGATLAGAGVAEGATLRLERAAPEAPPVEAELPPPVEAPPAEPTPPPLTPTPPVAPVARRAGLPRWAWAVGGVVLVAVLVGVWALAGKLDRKLHTLGTARQTWGHSVNVAFSPDGRILATGLFDLTVWDIETGQQLRSMEVGDHCVNSPAFSPDGMIVASGGCACDVSLYDAQTGSHLRTLVWEGHQNPAYPDEYLNDYYTSVSFSPDGTTLASGMAEGTVILWDAHTGQQLRTLVEGYPTLSMAVDALMPVAFSPDGTILASLSIPDGEEYLTPVLWDVETGRQLHTLKALWGGFPRDLIYSPDGRMLAAAVWGDAVLCDARTGQQVRTFERETSDAYSVAFSPDGATLATGWEDGWVIVWDVETGRKLYTLRGHEYGVSSVAFSPDGNLLASGSSDGTAILWDVAR